MTAEFPRARRRARSLLEISAVAMMGLCVLPQAGSAAPNLFSGSVDFLDQFGTLPWTTTVAPANPRIAEVTPATPAASFMIPGGVFANYNSFPSLTYLPSFQVVTFESMSTQRAGAFGPNFIASTRTIPANTTAYPNLSASPRSGFLRLVPGPNGFGGTMPVRERFATRGVAFASVGYYDVSGTRDVTRGVPTAVVGPINYRYEVNQTVTTNGLPLVVTRLGGATVAPWITGMATAQNPVGYYVTTITRTGVDGRNAAGTSGPISLVSPTLTFRYSRFGGALTGLDNGSSAVFRTDLLFSVPEPAHAMLLGAGMVGLVGLARRRGRSAASRGA